MKIAIFADIHGNVPALESIINDIKEQGINEIIFLGDIVGLGPKPKECLDLIIQNNIKMVVGNNELYTLYGSDVYTQLDEGDKAHYTWTKEQLTDEQIEYLKNLPLVITKEINGKKYLFEHFPIYTEKANEYPFENFEIIKNGRINKILSKSSSDYIFIGHEHLPFEINENNKILIDVGSSGCRKDDSTNYTILDIDGTVRVEKKELKFDRDKLLKDIKETDYPERDFLANIFFGVEK